jgi:hypothetical protein
LGLKLCCISLNLECQLCQQLSFGLLCFGQEVCKLFHYRVTQSSVTVVNNRESVWVTLSIVIVVNNIYIYLSLLVISKYGEIRYLPYTGRKWRGGFTYKRYVTSALKGLHWGFLTWRDWKYFFEIITPSDVGLCQQFMCKFSDH